MDEEALEHWIEEQKLESIFDKRISRDSIKWFVKSLNPKKISEMNREELIQYLDGAISLINYRNAK